MNDDPLHDLFDRAAPPTASPAHTRQALDGLRPGFEGALRRHRIRVGAAATAATFALAGGAAALGALGSGSTDEIDPVQPGPDTSIGDAEIVEGDLDPPTDDGSTTDPDGGLPPADDPTPSVPPTATDTDTTDADDGSTEREADDENDGAGGEGANESGDEADDEAVDDREPVESTATTTPPSSTTPADGRETATTPGGSITVSFDGAVIDIESIDEGPGFTYDLTEQEPQEVKVYFYGNGEEYEVEITVEHGVLVIEDEQSGS